jgi:SEC-C motif
MSDFIRVEEVADLEGIAPTPTFTQQQLSSMSAQELFAALIEHEDRVPMVLFEACAARGTELREVLSAFYDAFDFDDVEGMQSGHWWVVIHGVHLLGQWPDETSGRLLAGLWRRLAEEEVGNWMEWLVEHWPEFFANKPDTVFEEVRAILRDRGMDWFPRSAAIEVLLHRAQAEGAEALELAIDTIADALADDSEDADFRWLGGALLLDFPRQRHRDLLLRLASQQVRGMGAVFLEDEVYTAFKQTTDKPSWQGRDSVTDFYDSDQIRLRQIRWRDEPMSDEYEDWQDLDDDLFEDEDLLEDDDLLEDAGLFEPVPQPFVRAEAKIGRNDPCPCGSGKKYKRCCLH